MNSLGKPECVDELACVRNCPELRRPLMEGDFEPSFLNTVLPDSAGRSQRVAVYHFPNSQETFVFNIRPINNGLRWRAWADYCPQGRKATDACYDFLDGGGSFGCRRTAEWAIHVYVAHLYATEDPVFETFPSHGSESIC